MNMTLLSKCGRRALTSVRGCHRQLHITSSSSSSASSTSSMGMVGTFSVVLPCLHLDQAGGEDDSLRAVPEERVPRFRNVATPKHVKLVNGDMMKEKEEGTYKRSKAQEQVEEEEERFPRTLPMFLGGGPFF